MENISFVQLNNNKRIKILNKLGYGINNQGYIIDSKNKKEVVCKYSGGKVHINTAAILPGSIEIINANPVTMADYFMDKDNQDE